MSNFSIVFVCLFFSGLNGLSGQVLNLQKDSINAEQVVRKLYDLVTFEANNTPDWEEVKSLFVEEATVVLRVSRTAHKIFSRQAFVDDFQNFIDQSKVDQTGFVEKIVSLKIMEMGNIAHGWVVYEASIPGSPRPPQQGVDSFQLLKKDGQWLIVSIVNEIPTAEKPVPEEILKQ